MRTRDAQRRWSLTSQQSFFTTVLAPANQALTAAEYFVDQEPGLGRGTAIGLSAGQASATVSFNVGLSAVSTGFHTLYLRTRDAQGAWSLTQAQAFYVLSVPPAGQALARAEYFIDQDPGLGNGTAIALPAGQQSASVAFNVSLANVAIGAHTLYLRSADKGKAWSLTQQQAFLVKPGGELATITSFEYDFTGIEANASYTSGTVRYAVPTPAASVNLNFTADLSQLPGNVNYDMHVWAISSEGLRSLVQTKRIRNCNNLPVKAGFDLAQDGRQVYFVNASTNADHYRWSFGDGATDTTANPLHTYAAIGNYTVRLISSSFCNPDTITKVVSIRGIKDITTNHGGNTGAVSVVVTGAGFVPGMQLLLRRAGQADIVGDTVVTRSVGVLTTEFDLVGKALGQWDVIVLYPGGFSATLTNGFTVETTILPQVTASISGSSVLRIGFDQVYTITCSNKGNVDAAKIPLFIGGLPLGTTIEVISPVINSDLLPSLGALHLTTRVLRHTWNDTLNGNSYRILYLDKLPAGAAGAMGVIFHVPLTTPLHSVAEVRVHLGTPASHFYVSASKRGGSGGNLDNVKEEAAVCDTEILEQVILKVLNKQFPGKIGKYAKILGFQPCAVGIVQRVFDEYVKPKSEVSMLAPGPYKLLEEENKFAANLLLTSACWRAAIATIGAAATAFTDTPEFLDLAIEADAIEYAIEEDTKFEEKIASRLDDAALINHCLPLFVNAGRQLLHVIIGNATDPNAKYGPGGGSTHHYINKDAPLSYAISFENLPTANLNAQTVRVTDTLSTQAFDLASFAFTSVTVGTSIYALPAPAKSFVHDFDFVQQYGVKARVIGTFDAATGIVRWTFFSIDPATDQVTTNALAGFLPPDAVSPKGQGYVSFTVQPNPARQTGDIIHNKASIVFDYNAPIVTNDWHNTFDLVRPSSAVTTVTSTPADSVFHVNWVGTDTGSGIQSYDILYTVNGHQPRTWLASTSATTALFTGRRDSTYCFYSIARDSAGNVEAAPLVPDACKTLMVLSQHPATTATPEGFTVYPNPTAGVFTVAAYALKPEQSSIQIENMVGQIVYSEKVRLTGGTLRREIDASRFTAGIYFVKMNINGKPVVQKLVKN
ncbi:MAG: DUF7619 domain-containing protein [Janthinobacterium lividum]